MAYTLADAGSMRVDGIDVVGHPREVLARMGVLSDARGLYPRLTARENIVYYGALHGMERGAADARAEELARMLEMTALLDRRAAGFSQGERMKTARMLTVRTAGGTDFTATFDPELAWVKTSGLINPRYWSNLPAGEVFTTPASVDGVFVCDGTAGDYFNGKYGILEGTPLRLEIRGGRLISASCERSDLEQDFWSKQIEPRNYTNQGNERNAKYG